MTLSGVYVFCFYSGLLAKKAIEAGLSVNPYIKTSLSPGSGVVTYYLKESGVTPYLEKLGYVSCVKTKCSRPMQIIFNEINYFIYCNDLLTRRGCMEDCGAMHKCWTIGQLHRQKRILAMTKAQPIEDSQKVVIFHKTLLKTSFMCHLDSICKPNFGSLSLI